MKAIGKQGKAQENLGKPKENLRKTQESLGKQRNNTENRRKNMGKHRKTDGIDSGQLVSHGVVVLACHVVLSRPSLSVACVSLRL